MESPSPFIAWFSNDMWSWDSVSQSASLPLHAWQPPTFLVINKPTAIRCHLCTRHQSVHAVCRLPTFKELKSKWIWKHSKIWVAFLFSRGSSQPTDQAQVSRIADGFFTSWATREAQYEVINSTLKKKNKKKLRTLPKTEPHELTYGVDFPKWDCPASRMIFACWVSCFSLSCQYE